MSSMSDSQEKGTCRQFLPVTQLIRDLFSVSLPTGHGLKNAIDALNGVLSVRKTSALRDPACRQAPKVR
jgi:hypothetical protein